MITKIVRATNLGVQLTAIAGVGILVAWGVRAITPSKATTVEKVVTIGSGLIIAYWATGRIACYVYEGFAGLEEWAEAKDENHKAKKEAKKAAKELKKVTKERA